MTEDLHIEPDLKAKTAKGLLWGGVGNGLIQLLNLVFGIFLARLLTPHDYGMVGYLAIFSVLGSSIQECGFTNALVNQKTIRHEDYNAAFWFSIFLGISCYLILFFTAPLIANFYNEPRLVPLSRYLFLSFVISSTVTAHNGFMMKKLMVKQKTLSQIIGLLVSGTVGVVLAYNGYAYWGIATQTVTYVLVYAITMWCFSPWRPTFHFNFKPIKSMIGFSAKVLVTNVFIHINNNIFTVLLGRLYTSRDVGNYTQAAKWNQMGYSLISNMIQGVAQPVLKEVEEERERQLRVFRKMLRFTAFVSFPAMLTLALVSKEFITIAITDKWLNSAVIMQMLCVWGAFFPIGTLYTNMILSKGKSGVYMYGTIALGVLQLAVLIATAHFGITVMIIAFVIVNALWLLVWHYFVHHYLGLTLWQALLDIVPFAVVALGTVVAVHFITLPIANIYVLLVVRLLLSAIIYLGIMKLLNAHILNEAFDYVFRRRKQPDNKAS